MPKQPDGLAKGPANPSGTPSRSTSTSPKPSSTVNHNDNPRASPDMDDLQSPERSPERSPPPQSKPAGKPRRSTAVERLMALPEVRPVPWRHGVGAVEETGGVQRQLQIRAAILLSSRGDVNATPCNRCKDGLGKFALCVSSPDFFDGSCATCHFSGAASGCNLRQTTVTRADVLARGRSTQRQSAKPKPGSASKGPRVKDEVDENRRRHTIHDMGSNGHGNEMMGYLPPGQGTPSKHPRDHRSPYAVEGGEAVLRDYAPAENNSEPPAKRHKPGEPPMGQFAPPYNSGPPRAFAELQYIQRPPVHVQTINSFADGMDGAQRMNGAQRSFNEPDKPLIDTMPQSKQRQIFSAVVSIQSGINTLQTQLDSLKTTLGIEDDH